MGTQARPCQLADKQLIASHAEPPVGVVQQAVGEVLVGVHCVVGIQCSHCCYHCSCWAVLRHLNRVVKVQRNRKTQAEVNQSAVKPGRVDSDKASSVTTRTLSMNKLELGKVSQ